MIKDLLGVITGIALLGFVCSTIGVDVELVLAATHAAYSNQCMPIHFMVSICENRLTIG